MIPLGITQKESDENRKMLSKKGKVISLLFFLSCLLPLIIYLIFHFGLLKGKSPYNEMLEQSVAFINTGTGTGTAFLVSPTKLLTAKHVVQDKNIGDVVELVFEKANPQIATSAKVVWKDPTSDPEPGFYLKDVALLELENPTILPEDYPYLSLGQSEGITTRTDVILIGFPSGLMSTTSGSISNDNIKGFELFQLDVEAWPGNSGGPLILEETEEVIGILVAGMSEEYQGINFANKIDNVVSLLEINGIDIYE